MPQKSRKELSLVGLILLVLSALIAAFSPIPPENKTANYGTLIESDSEGELTCVPNQAGPASCTRTIGSETSYYDQFSRNEEGLETVNNTSNTGGVLGQQSSLLALP